MSVHTMITVAPPTLLVDKSIREAKLSKAFMERVHEPGVLSRPSSTSPRMDCAW